MGKTLLPDDGLPSLVQNIIPWISHIWIFDCNIWWTFDMHFLSQLWNYMQCEKDLNLNELYYIFTLIYDRMHENLDIMQNNVIHQNACLHGFWQKGSKLIIYISMSR